VPEARRVATKPELAVRMMRMMTRILAEDAPIRRPNLHASPINTTQTNQQTSAPANPQVTAKSYYRAAQASTAVVGTVAVSRLPQAEDHELVVAALEKYLG
jgi:hypothetical protein